MRPPCESGREGTKTKQASSAQIIALPAPVNLVAFGPLAAPPGDALFVSYEATSEATSEATPYSPTEDVYCGLDYAYSFFNAQLFGGRLRPCLITLTRRTHTLGYFVRSRFRKRDGPEVTDEIALNPQNFLDRSVVALLQTLCHEMCHQAQSQWGSPGRGGYHNKEFAALMRGIGLPTSDTGAPGGKSTGQRMADYVEPGGRFERACGELLAGGFTIDWGETDERPKPKPSRDKVAFCCEQCGIKLWGEPSLRERDVRPSCGQCR
jgi:hypothetical protein